MQNSDEKKAYQIGTVQSGLLLTVLFLLYMLAYADRQIFSVALQPMKTALNLSDGQLGILQSVFSIGLGIMAIPAAILVDRWSRRKAIGIMAILWSIATWATGICRSFAQLIIPRAFVGIGEAGVYGGGTTWLSVVYPKDKRARIMSIFTVGSIVGIVVGSFVGGWIITVTNDWSSPFWIFAIPGIVLGIVTFFFKDYSTVSIKQEMQGEVKSGFWAQLIGLFKIRAYVLVVLSYIFFSMCVQTVAGWCVALIMRSYNVDTTVAGGAFALAILISAIFAPVIGWLADLWHKRSENGRAWMLVTLQIINTLGILTMLLTAGIVSLPIFLVFLVVAAGLHAPIGGVAAAMIADVVPVKLRASGFGFLMVGNYLIGSALGAYFSGIASDAFGGGAYGLKMGLLCLVPAMVIAAIFQFANTRKIYVQDAARCIDEIRAEE